MKVCAQPSCPRLVDNGSWCPNHKPAPRRGPSGTLRYLHDTKWRKLRAAYLRRHPHCECGCGRPSRDVDHRDGLGLDGPRAYDWHNLVALTHSCHSTRTARQGSRAARGLPTLPNQGGGQPPSQGDRARGAVASLGQKPLRRDRAPRGVE